MLSRARSRMAYGGSLAALALLTGLCLTAAVARAQGPRGEARLRFERGVELFDEGHLDGALAEFQRAYDIAPTYRVLYNLGRVYQELGDAVRAVSHYRRYLAEGGGRIPARRRRDVRSWLDRLQRRIATVRVTVNVDSATVSVDGADVGRTPLGEALLLAAGTHTLAARAPGHTEARRSIQMAGGTETEIALVLTPVRGASLEIDSPVPRATVLIDGREVGTTPLAESLPITPGRYVVEVRRAGYLPDRREVTVAQGAEAVVRLVPRRRQDIAPSRRGTLELALPESPFELVVDGERIPARRLELPVGPHAIRLDVSGRQRVRATLEIAAGESTLYRPALRWDTDARGRRLEAASTQRLIGWLVAGGGLAIGAIGGFIAVGAASRQSDLAGRIDALDRQIEACGGGECPGLREDRNGLAEEHNAEADLVRLSGGIAAVGVIPLIIGLYLLLSADSEEDIDRAASAAADPGVQVGVAGRRLDLRVAF